MQNIKKVKAAEIIKVIKPTIFNDGSMEYTVQGFTKDGKGCFERRPFNSYGDLDKLKKDLAITIRCAGYDKVETIKVNNVDIKEYLVF